jgi:hypothetical protein
MFRVLLVLDEGEGCGLRYLNTREVPGRMADEVLDKRMQIPNSVAPAQRPAIGGQLAADPPWIHRHSLPPDDVDAHRRVGARYIVTTVNVV